MEWQQLATLWQSLATIGNGAGHLWIPRSCPFSAEHRNLNLHQTVSLEGCRDWTA